MHLKLFIVILLIFKSSYAADFLPQCLSEKVFEFQVCDIKMQGEIVPGDAKKFRQFLERAPGSNTVYNKLLLSSRGGDVSEALRIGEDVKKALLATTTVEFNLKNRIPRFLINV